MPNQTSVEKYLPGRYFAHMGVKAGQDRPDEGICLAYFASSLKNKYFGK